MTRAHIALGALAYAALVAHLLFIPYWYSPLPFDETLHRFAQIPWLQLGSDQNVALVSRGLMFLPLGLLLAACVTPQPRRIELSALLVAVVVGCVWAVVVSPKRAALCGAGSRAFNILPGVERLCVQDAALVHHEIRSADGRSRRATERWSP